MKTISLAIAVSLAMLGSAVAMGVGNPSEGGSVPPRFVVTVPAIGTGSMAYPSTQGTGSDQLIVQGLHFNPALYNHADTGGQQSPVGLP